jgi:multicomponent Na+:H+ antiporter subunit D
MIAINTGLVLIAGALLLPLLGKQLSRFAAVAVAAAGLAWFLMLPSQPPETVKLFQFELMPLRIDHLSWIFGLIFHIAAVISTLYALHVQDTKQHIGGLVYAGAAIVAALAGDLITLFIAWELTAISSVVLVWASNNETSYRAGMRYLVIQVGSGVLLLSGVILHYHDKGSLLFGHFMDLLPGDTASISDYPLAAKLIFVAFGMKCAFPLLHNWLQDAYPKATITGTVFLSAFTTKLAVYALARGFAGTEELIWVGCTMTLFPIVFAVIENDLRRVLAYSLNNQLGFMVVGIGIELALNGTAAHAFCHIIYKAVLFMSMGAVMYRVGTAKATELGGLHKSMPWTTAFCIIGGGAIAGFPLLSGFVSKSMIISAAGEQHMYWVWIVLLIASAGVMEHSGIKIPFFAFFAHDSGKRVKEAPWNMLLAMGIGAAFCIGIGVWYQPLYQALPFPFDEHHVYKPYTNGHVILQMQLLLFAALAFVVLMKTGLYPDEKRAENLDTDWVYRKALPMLVGGVGTVYTAIDRGVRKGFVGFVKALIDRLDDVFNETGTFGKTWSTSAMAFWSALILGVFLVLYYM